MFEQELYNHEASELQTQPGDLFHNYEIRNWNFSPRLYKILGISAVFNILAVFVIGTSGLLTARGCDSPFVGRVCQVLDTVYIASLVLGTDGEYKSAPYEKTDLGDAEVTFIDVSGVEPPLSYPAGYFALANPEQQFSNVTDPMAGFGGNLIPGFPNPTNPTIGGRNLIDTPAIAAPNNPNAIDGKLSTKGPLGGNNPTVGNVGGGRKSGRLPDNNNPTDTNSVAGTDEESTPPVVPIDPLKEGDINRKPFEDLATVVNAMRAGNEFNLDAEFSVSAKGKLDQNGKLDKKTFRFTKAVSADPKMVGVVKQSIEAFNDSGLLFYLSQLSGKDLNFFLEQGKENISGEVRSELERESRAIMLSSLMASLIKREKERKEKAVMDLQAENNPDNAARLQNVIDEIELLKNTTVVAEGNKLVIKFAAPKAVMHNMINRKLDSQGAKDVKKESGSKQPRLNENTAKN